MTNENTTYTWDIPDNDLAGYWISGKTKHGKIAGYQIFGHFYILDTGYVARYPVSKIPDI